NVPVFIFNKTTFDKAGIEIPTSWEELEAAGPAMQKALGDTYYPLSTLMPYDLFYEYTYEATGTPIFDEDGNFNWTKEDILVGLNEYQKLIDNNVIPSTEQAPDEMTQGDPQWIDGEWAGAITWSGSVTSWQDSLQEGDEIVVVPTLSMEGAKSSGKVIKPAMSYAIADNCEYKDETADFLNWFVSSEPATLDLGMTRGMVDNPDAIKILEENKMLEGPAYEAYITTKDIESAPMPLLSGDTNSVILDGLSNLRYGSKTSDEVADDIYAEFTK
ncbi:MAG: ABC transporter substrate-binding protein, partial [Coprobacillaceae bacterium]